MSGSRTGGGKRHGAEGNRKELSIATTTHTVIANDATVYTWGMFSCLQFLYVDSLRLSKPHFNHEEMLTKDAAEAAQPVEEAPTLVLVLCLCFAAPVVLSTIAQTLLESKETDSNLTIVHSNALHCHQFFFHRPVSSNASVPLTGRNLS